MNKREYLNIIYADYVINMLSDDDVDKIFKNIMKNTDIINKVIKNMRENNQINNN